MVGVPSSVITPKFIILRLLTHCICFSTPLRSTISTPVSQQQFTNPQHSTPLRSREAEDISLGRLSVRVSDWYDRETVMILFAMGLFIIHCLDFFQARSSRSNHSIYRALVRCGATPRYRLVGRMILLLQILGDLSPANWTLQVSQATDWT